MQMGKKYQWLDLNFMKLATIHMIDYFFQKWVLFSSTLGSFQRSDLAVGANHPKVSIFAPNLPMNH